MRASNQRKSSTFKSERAAEIAAAKKSHENKLKEIKRKFSDREKRAAAALRHFRPRKSDRGKILFIGVKGGRLPVRSAKRGYAVYINRKGRKNIVRQISKITGKLEKAAAARKITGIDISRARSKTAKRNFLTAYTNEVARGELRKSGKHGMSHKGTRYEGTIKTDEFYENADSVEKIAKELVRASNGTRSKKDFLVTIGIVVKDKSGKMHWIEFGTRFSRRDGQTATVGETKAFLGKVVYANLAKELSDRDLVLQGSARHIARLKENKGKSRDKWRKDGFLWQGHDQNDVSIERVEYRFDQLTLTA